MAEGNIGSKYTPTGREECIAAIASQPWIRFDDRLGLAHEELERHQATSSATLPVTETLLNNKPFHIAQRGEDKTLDPRHGFRFKVPENHPNTGEIYNISIRRGTLNAEERLLDPEQIDTVDISNYLQLAQY